MREPVSVLSETWCDRVVALTTGAAPVLRDVTVELQVTGAPTGLGRVGLTVEGGRLVGLNPGSNKGAQLTLKLGWDDAVAILRGDLDPSVAFMTGGMKTDGPTGPLLALLAAWNRPAAKAARATLVGDTDFSV